MVRRSTAVVVFILIILVVIALFLQRENDARTVDEISTPTPVTSLFDITTDSLSKVEIEKTGGSRLIMERDEQGIWSFVEPEGHEVDQEEAQSIAGLILSLNALTRLEKSSSLEVLGLDKPSHRIVLLTREGKEEVALIGNLTATSSGYYVSRFGQIPVIISKTSIDEILEKIETPPIFVTQTPSITPVIAETAIPQATQTP